MHELGRLFLHGGADPPDQRLGDVLVMNLQTKADFTALMHKFLDPAQALLFRRLRPAASGRDGRDLQPKCH